MSEWEDPILLNIGSGSMQQHPWLSVDLHGPEAGWDTDIVADCRVLPLDDDTVERVFFGHMLEHLSYEVDAPQALREAYRVLKVNGQLGVVGPAMDYALEMGCDAELLDDIGVNRSEKWAECDATPGGAHLWEATSLNTLVLVQSVFPTARIVNVNEVSLNTGWAMTNAGTAQWQVAILAYKETS